MDFLNELLIQLLFILITWLLMNSFSVIKFKSIDILNNKIVICLLASLQIIGCIVMAYPVYPGFYYDLRFLPFLIGSVYGGRLVTIYLALLVIITRIPYGGPGIWASVGVFLFFLILFMYAPDHILKAKRKKRIVLVTLMAGLYSFLVYVLPAYLYEFFDLRDFLIYVGVQSISILFIVYFLELLRDYNALQQEAIHMEKMQVVSHLAASISHEIRNPLTTVKGFLQLIDENAKEETIKRYTSIAIEETDRATAIIEDCLTFAKPNEGKMEDINLADSIDKVLALLNPYARQKSICLQREYETNAFIKGDPNKWIQVLVNICKNGIESMQENGKLTIRILEDESNILVQVQDTGKGMRPDQIARLGQPFYSIKDGKGTGLGMMVVFQIVRTMGGRVQVESVVNSGTTVSIIFPLSIVFQLKTEENVLHDFE